MVGNSAKNPADDVLVRHLLAWFRKAKRPMPWRTAPAPYSCWLSEIMLQQTSYEQALPYYRRFLARFPTVEDLASADEQEVLKAWEGLGYYARARNLRHAAQRIVETGWPQSAAEWAALPGVGPYTAAALASVLSGERIPVVDGNVARVFARLRCLNDNFRDSAARTRLAETLQPLLDHCTATSLVKHPNAQRAAGAFNQAMMELGALVCLPSGPHCDSCPLAAGCAAHRAGRETEYPVRPPPRERPVRRRQAVLVRDAEGRVLLVRNDEGGLLKGLWDLPALSPAGHYAQAFSHFQLELDILAAGGAASFIDPATVPLTTSARKVLVASGVLASDPQLPEAERTSRKRVDK
ncbi:MAG: A/G-specific adenine glycosylase [Kiritimatiellae bacterium]|nr:A/G-specific adenine glycosylase [Kiritimatiellia bacterium]